MGSYVPPAVGTTGLSIPTYSQILQWLIGNYLGIFGSSVYLGADSSDYEDLAIRALQASDVNQALQAVWLSFNPQTAIGTSLDLIGKLIGTSRNAATNSTVTLTITGTPGTVINSGQVQDVTGNYWNLPATVIIPSGGSINVTGIAQIPGVITANPGAIIIISTPTAGWSAVTNEGAALPGEAVEPDSQYRARLAISQAKPSLSLLAGTAAAIAAVQNVTRSQVYENPFGFTTGFGLVSTSGTSVTRVAGYIFDSSDIGQFVVINGVTYTIATVPTSGTLTITISGGTQTNVPYYIGGPQTLGPAHSITCVVEGGTSSAIAQTIYNNKNPGVDTNGTTTVNIVDPTNGNISIPISFDILTYVQIYVTLNVHALVGFTSAVQAAIAANLVAYLNTLGIGEPVIYSQLYGPALAAQPNQYQPAFSILSLSSGYEQTQTTGTVTMGSPTVTVSSATGIVNGQTVTGIGIPNDTTITISGTTVTLSNNATISGTLVSLNFFNVAQIDIPIGYASASQGFPINIQINLV